MCFGVRDAIVQAQDAIQAAPLTILGELVHNETVLDDLRRRGIRLVKDPARLEVEPGPVMITAHGASEHRLEALRARGLRIIEATCPLVHAAHRAVMALERDGYFPVIVGRADHVEVRGLTEDLAQFAVVLSEDDLAALPARARYGVAAQTTQPIDRVRHLANGIRSRFPEAEVRLVDTVCQPTKLRQHAATELALRCDVVLVIGGAHSNNTRELVATCALHCARVHHLQGPEGLDPGWFEGAATVGITAGTSTPDGLIEAVEGRLRELVATPRGH
jgi:4-hydroxy-3-methylbut-2-enyl diphosphate reductase